MENINIKEKFSKIDKYWTPYIIGELNGQYVKIAKVKGDFVWHKHENEDELFMVFQGTLLVDFKDKTVELSEGETLIVPKGIDHRPRTNGEEVHILMFEPKSTLNTGNHENDITIKDLEWL